MTDQPNPTLVTEASTLRPGRALDVGCGEGGDAVWLARHGWKVTALDPSSVALGRAQTAARAAGVDVTWIRAGLHATRFCTAQTTTHRLRRCCEPSHPVARCCSSTTNWTPTHAAEHGLDLTAHVMPDTLAAHLDGHWDVQVFDTRERRRDQVPKDQSPRDIVLRVRRR